MGAKILLPVRAHIKKYLEYTHGNQMEVSDRGYASFLLLQMLEKHKKQDPGTVRPSQKLIDHKNYFAYPVYIGNNYENSKGLYISTANIKRFNDTIDDLFREQMYAYINHPNSTTGVVDYDIVGFRELYGISEDELPFDNLKRWYYRERLRIVSRKNWTPPFVPQFTLSL
ncbi:MAG: hypothetical protein EOP55_10490 [Sphingobacteriales bacterium]|nr:MAG: hypothetical protein EOP55_10490 [Sphingobacteriales bacterium]